MSSQYSSRASWISSPTRYLTKPWRPAPPSGPPFSHWRPAPAFRPVRLDRFVQQAVGKLGSPGAIPGSFLYRGRMSRVTPRQSQYLPRVVWRGDVVAQNFDDFRRLLDQRRVAWRHLALFQIDVV